MKKIILCLSVLLLITGCGSKEVFKDVKKVSEGVYELETKETEISFDILKEDDLVEYKITTDDKSIIEAEEIDKKTYVVVIPKEQEKGKNYTITIEKGSFKETSLKDATTLTYTFSDKKQEKENKSKSDEEIVKEAINNFLEADSYKVVSTSKTKVIDGVLGTFTSNYSIDNKNNTYLENVNGNDHYGSITDKKDYYKYNGEWLYDYFYSYIYLGFEERTIISYLANGTITSEKKDNKTIYTIVVPKDKLTGIEKINLSAHIEQKYQANADLKAALTIKDSNIETLSFDAKDLIYGEGTRIFDIYEENYSFFYYNKSSVTIPEEAKNARIACDPNIEPC